MEKFVRHTGVGVPLRRSNVDTDQIIPAVYLKRVPRTGFEDGLFAAWRTDPSFVLNQEPYRNGSVLVAGPDFGTWSALEASPGVRMTVDLEGRTASVGGLMVPFGVDDYTRWRLMEGLDDIGLTLRHADDIDAFEARRPGWLPTTLPVP